MKRTSKLAVVLILLIAGGAVSRVAVRQLRTSLRGLTGALPRLFRAGLPFVGAVGLPTFQASMKSENSVMTPVRYWSATCPVELA